MAVPENCHVCGAYPPGGEAGRVRFADYDASWSRKPAPLGAGPAGPGPQADHGRPGVMWVCEQHEGPAAELRHLPLAEALQLLRPPARGWWRPSLRGKHRR